MRKKLAEIYVQFFGNFTKWYRLSYNESKSACPKLSLLWSVKLKQGHKKAFFWYVRG